MSHPLHIHHPVRWLLALALLVLVPLVAHAQAPTYITSWGTCQNPGADNSSFYQVGGIAVDAAGNVYVTDAWSGTVSVYSGSGVFLERWGSRGLPGQLSAGQMASATSLAVAPFGVFVYDAKADLIHKWTDTGTFVRWWPACGNVTASPSGYVYLAGVIHEPNGPCNALLGMYAPDGSFVRQWAMPAGWDGLTVDAAGTIYAVSKSEGLVRKYSDAGDLLRSWGALGYGNSGGDWSPSAIALDGYGRIYVTDLGGAKVYVFDNNGNFLLSWGTYGADPGQFNGPGGIAIASDGTIYVLDRWLCRITAFGPMSAVPAVRTTWGQVKTLYR